MCNIVIRDVTLQDMAKIYIMETKDDNRVDVSAEVIILHHVSWVVHDTEIWPSENGTLCRQTVVGTCVHFGEQTIYPQHLWCLVSLSLVHHKQ